MTTTLRDWTIPTGGAETVNITGEFLAIVKANQPELLVRLDNEAQMFVHDRQVIRRPQGMTFEQVRVENLSSGSELVVTVHAGFGELVLPPRISINQGSSIDTPSDVSVPAGGEAQIVALDVTRRSLVLTNPSSNSREFRIGGGDVGAGAGVELTPGGTLVLETSAAVHAHNPHTDAQSVQLVEFKD
jgi:hypothetical protein